ncbi:MAG: hypothetical protein M3220_03700 [Chloroflexota bacterium]|nr:hypothetical protein [Chloroflexota bacterium]
MSSQHAALEASEEAVPGNSENSTSPRKERDLAVTSILFFKEEEERDREVEKEVYLIAQALETHGVFEVPALEIAFRAHDAGLGATETVELFEAQVADATRSQAVDDPIAVAIWRMLNRPLTPPEAKRKRSAKEQRFLAFMSEQALPEAEPSVDAASAIPPAHQATTSFPLATQAGDPEPTRASDQRTGEPPSAAGSSAEGEALLHGAPPSGMTSQHAGSRSETERLWQAVLADLQGQMTRATFDSWLRDTCLERAEDGGYIVSTRQPGALAWLENRLGQMIEASLRRQLGQPCEVQYVVRGEVAAIPDTGEVGYHSASSTGTNEHSSPQMLPLRGEDLKRQS